MATIDPDLDAVVGALRDNPRFLVVSHENPDGDALGSLLATHLALEALENDSVMVLGGEAPLPGEYAVVQGLPIDEFSRERMNLTLKELEEERAGVADLLR